MRAYKARFKKKNGDMRNMFFAKLEDLPDAFVDDKVSDMGDTKMYPDGMQLVWDLEQSNFRVFNWKTLEGKVEILNIDEIEIE